VVEALVAAAEASGVELLRAATEVATVALLVAAMLLLRPEATAVVVAAAAAALVEATATHLALAATLGGKCTLHRFTI